MYAKIFSQIYDGTLCTNGPWEALVTFQQLLILADQEGGVDMTIPAIARRTTIPREILERGIEALMLPDPESRTPTEEGRRIIPLSNGRSWGWRVVNYEKYRQIKREQDRRDYHRDYYHKRKSASVNTTQHDSTIQPIAEAEAEAEAEAKMLRKRAAPAAPLPEWVDADAWTGFEEMRIKAKKPMTVRAKALILAELQKLLAQGNAVTDVLDQSTRNGWQDVYAIKTQKVATSNQTQAQRESRASNLQARLAEQKA